MFHGSTLSGIRLPVAGDYTVQLYDGGISIRRPGIFSVAIHNMWVEANGRFISGRCLPSLG